MTVDREIQILTVGAGIGGLSLARFLQEIGIQPVVIETDEEFDGRGDVAELWPEAMGILEQLAVVEDVRAAGSVVTEWLRRQPDGTVANRLRAGESGGFVAIPYERLRELLLAPLDGASVRMGTTVRSVDASEHPVVVTFENGVREEFDLVIGADGANSRMRELLGGPAPVDCGTRSWAFPLPGSADFRAANEVWMPNGIVFRALPAGERAMASLTAPKDGVDGDDPTNVTTLLDDIGWLPVPSGEIDPDEAWSDDDVRVPSALRSEGRIGLIGDAARTHHRLAGVGPTLAIEDAAVLVSELVDREDELSARLQDYAARRRSRLERLPSSQGATPLGDVDGTLRVEHGRALDLRGAQLAAAFGPGEPPLAVRSLPARE